MGDVLVTDRETGEQRFIDESAFDKEKFNLAAGQVATVDPLGAGGEFAAGLEITPETLEAADPLQQVTAEARAALTREQVDEAVFDTASNTVEQSVRGVGSGVTFGLSELALRSGDPFERERQRRKRAQAPTAFAAGEIVGAVVPGLLTGGAGFVGTAARLTPAGRLSALSARVAARGTGLVQRVGTGAAAGAIEGAGQAIGAQLSHEALQESPDFSAESLASAGGLGGLLGGVLGGAIPAIGAGARRLRRTRGAQPAGVADLAADDLAGLGGPLTLERRGVGFDEIVSRQGQARVADDFGGLLGHVDDQGRVAASAAIEDVPRVVARMDELGIDDALATRIRGELSESANDFLGASNRATSWATEASQALGVDDISKLTPKQVRQALPDALEDRGADVLAELDDTAQRYQSSVAVVDQSLGDAVAAANTQVATNPALIQPGGLGERVRGVSDRFREALATRSGALETAGTVLGAAEVVRDVGGLDIPTARDLPGIGTAVSLWARYKAGVNAARRFGVLPANAATRGAAAVTSRQNVVQRAVARAARGVVAAGGSRLVRNLAQRSAKSVATQVVNLRSQDPAALAQAAQVAAGQADSRLGVQAAATAQRAHAFLVEQAPRNPLAGTINEDAWVPTEVQRRNWAVTLSAVADPIDAIERSFGDPYPDRAIAAIREVYPAIYADLQSRLMSDAPKLRFKMSPGRLSAIGRVYQIPLAITQQPSFRPSLVSPADQAAQAQPQGRTAAPRASTTSPLGTLALTRDQRRAVG